MVVTLAKATVEDPCSCQTVARVSWWGLCLGAWDVVAADILVFIQGSPLMCRGSKTTWTTRACVADRLFIEN